MNIWVVLDLAPKKRGSLEQQLVALAARLQRIGANLTVVLSDPPIDWLRDALRERNADIRILDFRRPARAMLAFARWLAAAPPALVHFHFVRAHSPLVVMARAAGARIVLHDHVTLGQAVPPYRDHSPTVKALLRPMKRLRAAVVNRCVDARLAVSLFVAASVMDAEHVPSERVEVIANGVDVGRFLEADPMALRWQLQLGHRPIVACVSRFSAEKGVDVLIRAMSQVRGDAALLIAGDGPDERKCRALAAERGLAERIHFLGLRDDVEKVYAAADVVVVPSLWDEAFGLSVVEAMAAGKPVVVTDSGAMPELIDNGACGAVVPKADDAAMAQAIETLLGDPERARQIGEAARRRAVERYPIERWVDELIGAYERAMPSLAQLSRVIRAEAQLQPTPPERHEDGATDERSIAG